MMHTGPDDRIVPAIRPFHPNDREVLLDVAIRAWESVFASLRAVLAGSGVFELLHPDWRAGQRRAVDAVCTADDAWTWVAEFDHTVAGFVAVRLHTKAGIGEMTMLAVDPRVQHRGVGSALTVFALDEIAAAGMGVAMVETGGDPGHAAARGLYQAAGFTPLPVVRYFKSFG